MLQRVLFSQGLMTREVCFMRLSCKTKVNYKLKKKYIYKTGDIGRVYRMNGEEILSEGK